MALVDVCPHLCPGSWKTDTEFFLMVRFFLVRDHFPDILVTLFPLFPHHDNCLVTQ